MALTKVPDAIASGAGWDVRRAPSGLVELRFTGFDSATVGEQIPAGFWPKQQTYVPVSATGAAGARIAITMNGVLTPQLYTGTAYGIVTYMPR